ncbi:unnamed protein product [Knipowitschia caucasica]
MMASDFLVLIFLLMFECTNTDSCGDDEFGFSDLLQLSSSANTSLIEIDEKNFTCLFYPTHEIKCSWSFQFLGMEAKVITNISICNGTNPVQTQEYETSNGSHYDVIEKNITHVILHFDIVMHGQWAVYYYKYHYEDLEVLPPPSNIQGFFKDNNLIVNWSLPCQNDCRVDHLEYELLIKDQGTPKHMSGKLSYTERNVDCTQSFTVSLRTRISEAYRGSYHWSDWSQPITIKAKQSTYQPTAAVVVAASLGLLLALLLVVCQSFRLSKHLFPPIPSPPSKYLESLQINEQFVSPAVNPEEEITIVTTKNEKTQSM